MAVDIVQSVVQFWVCFEGGDIEVANRSIVRVNRGSQSFLI